jgi:hypothetical protein
MSSSLATADRPRHGAPVRVQTADPIGDLLRDFVAGRPPTPAALASLDDDFQLSQLADLADAHGVVNAVFLGLEERVDAGKPAYRRLQQEYRDGVARHMRTLADLHELSQILTAAGVSWMVVKGPVLSELLYPRPDLRTYGDLDVLVEAGSFPVALAAVESAGFEMMDRNWEVIRSERRAQLHVVLRLGTVTDLHWHLLNREAVRDGFDISTEQLFARARTVNVGGEVVRTMSAEDTLTHLCVHAGLDGGHRLRSLKDIERAVAAGVNWDDVEERAWQWRARLVVATMLDRAAVHLGAEVPAGVLQRLYNSPLASRTGSRLGRRWSPATFTVSPRPGAVLVRSLRDDLPSTGRALLAKAFASRRGTDWVRVLRSHLGRSQRSVATGVLGALHPSGDDSTRAAYLSDVADGWGRRRSSGPVVLVCSTGGHLAQLHRLKPWWSQLPRRWVTFDKPDSRSLLAGEDVDWAYHPTTRNLPNLVRNTLLAWRVVRRERPSLIVSDGAGVALPFFLLGRVLRIPSTYIEVYDRIDTPSLTGRLCYRLCDTFVLQWDEQRKSYPNGTVIGRLL